VLRDLAGEGLSRWPSAAEIRALQARNPDVHAMVYPKRGADLAREMKWLGSYRYGVFNLGRPALEALFARFHRLCAEITFHPRGHRAPTSELLVGRSPRATDYDRGASARRRR
jgi:hypothetical protein